jgi:hypothetical protein
MKVTFLILWCLIILHFYSCFSIGERRNLDWQKEWTDHQTKLKSLTLDILENGSPKYKLGINDYPDGFKYPFDEGFWIWNYDLSTDTMNTKKIEITYYIDQGLLDDYSAFTYINDSAGIASFDRKVKNEGTNFKLEPNWYFIDE